MTGRALWLADVLADEFRGVQDHSDIANQFIEWIKAR